MRFPSLSVLCAHLRTWSIGIIADLLCCDTDLDAYLHACESHQTHSLRECDENLARILHAAERSAQRYDQNSDACVNSPQNDTRCTGLKPSSRMACRCDAVPYPLFSENP